MHRSKLFDWSRMPTSSGCAGGSTAMREYLADPRSSLPCSTQLACAQPHHSKPSQSGSWPTQCSQVVSCQARASKLRLVGSNVCRWTTRGRSISGPAAVPLRIVEDELKWCPLRGGFTTKPKASRRAFFCPSCRHCRCLLHRLPGRARPQIGDTDDDMSWVRQLSAHMGLRSILIWATDRAP